MTIDLGVVLEIWAAGGILLVAAHLYAFGWWAGLVEEMEDDNPGFPLLSPKQSAIAVLALTFIAWPWMAIETIRIIRNK